MAPPSIQSLATVASTGNFTTYSIPYPTGIQKGDLLVCYVNASATTAWTWGAGIAGWGVWDFNGAQSTARAWLTKWADGTESGTLDIVGPSENFCGVMSRISGGRRATPFGWINNSASSANPRTAELTSDSTENLWLSGVSGAGNVAFTVGPTGYSNTQLLLTTDGTLANRCGMGFASLEVSGNDTEWPPAWTRAAGGWQGNTVNIPDQATEGTLEPYPVDEFTHYSASGSPVTFAYELEGGSLRRLFFCVQHNGGAQTVSSITFGGQAASLCTDGTTNAALSQGNTRVEIWSIREADLPADGVHNVVVTLSAGVECTVTVLATAGAAQDVNVAAVSTVGQTTGTTITFAGDFPLAPQVANGMFIGALAKNANSQFNRANVESQSPTYPNFPFPFAPTSLGTLRGDGGLPGTTGFTRVYTFNFNTDRVMNAVATLTSARAVMVGLCIGRAPQTYGLEGDCNAKKAYSAYPQPEIISYGFYASVADETSPWNIPLPGTPQEGDLYFGTGKPRANVNSVESEINWGVLPRTNSNASLDNIISIAQGDPTQDFLEVYTDNVFATRTGIIFYQLRNADPAFEFICVLASGGRVTPPILAANNSVVIVSVGNYANTGAQNPQTQAPIEYSEDVLLIGQGSGSDGNNNVNTGVRRVKDGGLQPSGAFFGPTTPVNYMGAAAAFIPVAVYEQNIGVNRVKRLRYRENTVFAADTNTITMPIVPGVDRCLIVIATATSGGTATATLNGNPMVVMSDGIYSTIWQGNYATWILMESQLPAPGDAIVEVVWSSNRTRAYCACYLLENVNQQQPIGRVTNHSDTLAGNSFLAFKCNDPYGVCFALGGQLNVAGLRYSNNNPYYSQRGRALVSISGAATAYSNTKYYLMGQQIRDSYQLYADVGSSTASCYAFYVRPSRPNPPGLAFRTNSTRQVSSTLNMSRPPGAQVGDLLVVAIGLGLTSGAAGVAVVADSPGWWYQGRLPGANSGYAIFVKEASGDADDDFILSVGSTKYAIYRSIKDAGFLENIILALDSGVGTDATCPQVSATGVSLWLSGIRLASTSGASVQEEPEFFDNGGVEIIMNDYSVDGTTDTGSIALLGKKPWTETSIQPVWTTAGNVANMGWATMTGAVLTPQQYSGARPIYTRTVRVASANTVTFDIELPFTKNGRIVVSVSSEIAAAQEVTAVTVGGNALTRVTDGVNQARLSTTTGASQIFTEMWTGIQASLPAPGTVSVTVDISAVQEFAVTVGVYDGMKQEVPALRVSSGTATTTTPLAVPTTLGKGGRGALVVNEVRLTRVFIPPTMCATREDIRVNQCSLITADAVHQVGSFLARGLDGDQTVDGPKFATQTAAMLVASFNGLAEGVVGVGCRPKWYRGIRTRGGGGVGGGSDDYVPPVMDGG